MRASSQSAVRTVGSSTCLIIGFVLAVAVQLQFSCRSVQLQLQFSCSSVAVAVQLQFSSVAVTVQFQLQFSCRSVQLQLQFSCSSVAVAVQLQFSSVAVTVQFQLQFSFSCSSVSAWGSGERACPCTWMIIEFKKILNTSVVEPPGLVQLGLEVLTLGAQHLVVAAQHVEVLGLLLRTVLVA
jgi:hypothetical protein